MDLNIFTADHLLKIGLSAVFFTFIDRFGAVPISRALVPAYSQFKSYQVTQWNSRVAAIIHSVIVCPIAIYLLFQTELLNHPVTGVTQASDDLCCFAAGYFLWDLFMCFFYFKDYGVGFTIHAVCCLYTYLSHLAPVFHWYGMVFLLFELSTPFINLAWMMDKAGCKNATLAMANFGMAVLTFFVVRILFGIPPYVRATFVFVAPLLGLLNFYWFYMIVQFVLKQAKGSPKKE